MGSQVPLLSCSDPMMTTGDSQHVLDVARRLQSAPLSAAALLHSVDVSVTTAGAAGSGESCYLLCGTGGGQDVWAPYTGAGVVADQVDGTSCGARQQQALLLQAALLELESARAGLVRAAAESDRLRDLLRGVARERDAARQQCRQALLLLQLHLAGQHPATQQQQLMAAQQVDEDLAAPSSTQMAAPHPAFLLAAADNTSTATGSSSQGLLVDVHLAASAAPPPSASTSSDESSIVSSPPPPPQHQQQMLGEATTVEAVFGSVSSHMGATVVPPTSQNPPAPGKKMRKDQDESLSTDEQRPLPERGRLLEAVLNAGPLLQDLLLMGPLPQWHNPPPPPPIHGLDGIPPAAFGTGSGASNGAANEEVQVLGKRKERAGAGGELFMG